MAFEKPVVFFSHSSLDRVPLGKLKERFIELTGATIDVFLSSDGQSIRLGSNWIASVEAALNAAQIMFVFVSPNSLRSPWLYFETGHAYSKGIAVVPVGLFGVDIGQLSPPMNLLQGFNLNEPAALNNILTKVNETFRVNHRLAFTSEDFASLGSENQVAGLTNLLGKQVAAVAHVELRTESTPANLDRFAERLALLDGFARVDGSVLLPGVKAVLRRDSKSTTLVAELDPLVSTDVLAHIEGAFERISDADQNTHCRHSCTVTFLQGIEYEREPHRQLVRLGTGAAYAKDLPQTQYSIWLSWKDLRFSFWQLTDERGRPTQVELNLSCRASSFGEAHVGDLVDLLFERGILRYE